MSAFRKAVRDYISLRRSLGYKMVDAASIRVARVTWSQWESISKRERSAQ